MEQDVFERLGVKRVINGQSWVTYLGGSIMAPQVRQAMADAADCYVNIDELMLKAGHELAKHTGAEAGLVTAGAAAGMLLEAAACMTLGDPAKILQLPDTTGMKNEIIIPRTLRVGFDQAFRQAGAKLVEVGNTFSLGEYELEAAINERTAAVAYIFGPFLKAPLTLPQVVSVAHKHNVPVIVDASAMLPPAENLTRYIREGADMVTFSGGKGVCGPQSTGILCGRGDLIEAARLNMSPHAGVGRPTKVCKEEIIGLLTALDLFVKKDHAAEWKAWRAMSQVIVEALHEIPGLTVRMEDGDQNRQGPVAAIYFDPKWRGPSQQEVLKRLREGDPPIYIGSGWYRDELWVTPVTLRPGEERVVAGRLREALLSG
ncbi:MAG: aminotransferase class V-fold PLP-dependent enzyme [Chloroflexota bacterium]|nr:aminotransferase class V-fold PLP-dependent enzyme [Chloroflexota bacterium]